MKVEVFLAAVLAVSLTGCGPTRGDGRGEDDCDECSAGALACAGNGFRECRKDSDGCYVWTSITPCGEGEACTGKGICQPADSVCTHECDVGAKTCSGGDAFRTCEVDGKGCRRWSEPATCSGGLFCSAGSCSSTCSDQCAQNASACLGAQVRHCLRQPSGCLDWSAPAACPSGQECSQDQCRAAERAADVVEADVSFPFLFSRPSRDVFPTYLAHLLGKQLSRVPPEIGLELVCVALENRSKSTSWTITLKASLEGYSTPATRTITLAAQSSKFECITPAMDLDKLHALTSAATGSVHVELIENATSSPIRTLDRPVDIQAPNTVFWQGNGDKPLWDYAAVMSTPASDAVRSTLTSVKNRSGLPGQFGASPYDAVGKWFDGWTDTIPVNSYGSKELVLAAGEGLEVRLSSVTGGLDADVVLMLFDLANYNAWRQGSSSAVPVRQIPNAKTGASLNFTSPSGGKYVLVMQNSPSNWVPRSVSWTRTVTREDVARDVLSAIYSELQSRGLSYAHIAGNFFDSAQPVRWPSQSLSDSAANCIDGSVLFASLAELAGADPVLIIVPGHAYFGIRARHSSDPAGTGTVYAVETTMMGTHPFASAYAQGIASWLDDSTAKHVVDIAKARAQGISAIPR